MIWLHTAATYLGITDQQLLKELRSGKTPATIAKAHGKTVGGLEQELLQSAKKPLNDAVKSGRITKSQAVKIEKFLSQRIDQLITHGFEFHHSGWPADGQRRRHRARVAPSLCPRPSRRSPQRSAGPG